MARRLLILATPVVLLAGGWVLFYVLKDPPRTDGCDDPAPGAEAYREGLGTYATFAAAALGALIASTSRSKATIAALAATGWLAALYNLDNETFLPHATFGFLFGMFGGELLLLSSAVAMFAMRRPRVAELAYLWTSLLVFLPGATGIVATEGEWVLCMS